MYPAGREAPVPTLVLQKKTLRARTKITSAPGNIIPYTCIFAQPNSGKATREWDSAKVASINRADVLPRANKLTGFFRKQKCTSSHAAWPAGGFAIIAQAIALAARALTFFRFDCTSKYPLLWNWMRIDERRFYQRGWYGCCNFRGRRGRVDDGPHA